MAARAMRGSVLSWVLAAACAVASSAPSAAPKEPKAGREEGVYKIFVDGREVGSERYTLAVSGGSVSSSSVLDFQNPIGTPKKLHFESKLEMDERFRPRTYRLNTEVDGQRGFLIAQFSPNQVMFEYGGRGEPHRSGVLVGKDYTVLDTNMFHHFTFLARLYDFAAKEKVQRAEVVIPQESESGFLKLSEAGKETVSTGGKRHEARRLRVDSGAKQIDLWVDRDGVVRKIAVPSQKIEVVRNP